MSVKTMLLAIAAGSTMLLLGACGGSPEPTPSPAQAAAAVEAEVEEEAATHALAMTSWDLDYFGSPAEPVPIIPGSGASLTFLWDRYSGYDGCNWFLGVYNADDQGNMRIETPATTVNVCESEELNTQAATVETALVNVVSYEMQGEQLIVDTSENQPLMTFRPAEHVPTMGTLWEVMLWWDDDEAFWTPLDPATDVTISFGEGNTASGSGGCNNYSVPFEGDLQAEAVLDSSATSADLPTLTFGTVTAEEMNCTTPEGVMQQEQDYFTLLSTIGAYLKLGETLLLLDAEGTPVLALAPQPTPGD